MPKSSFELRDNTPVRITLWADGIAQIKLTANGQDIVGFITFQTSNSEFLEEIQWMDQNAMIDFLNEHPYITLRTYDSRPFRFIPYHDSIKVILLFKPDKKICFNISLATLKELDINSFEELATEVEASTLNEMFEDLKIPYQEP